MTIHKAGLLVCDERGRILLCRKHRGSPLLILPGGKLEPGESPEECVQREVREELGGISVNTLEFLGTYNDRAAGHASKLVQIELFSGVLDGTPKPSQEIRELVWFGPGDNQAQLAPSLMNKILPDLLARGLLRWKRD